MLLQYQTDWKTYQKKLFTDTFRTMDHLTDFEKRWFCYELYL